MSLTVNIRADRARLAASCMAKNDIRYYLGGILVEPRAEGGAYIVGCDGHRLIAVIDESGQCSESVILKLSPDMLRRMPKPRSYRDDEACKQRLQMEEFKGRPALVLTDKMTGELPEVVTTDVTIEGMFPDWRKVLPDLSKVKRGTVSAYQSRYLHEVLATFGNRGRPLCAVPYQVPSESAFDAGPIAFHIEGHEYAYLIVMPLRSDSPTVAPLEKNFSKKALLPTAKQAEQSVAEPA